MAYALTQERLRELLEYDQITGLFRWRVTRGPKAIAGAVAGTLGRDGYVAIVVDQRFYSAHRLAWFYVHGCWPRTEIDHINCLPADNRLENLREATRAENNQNRRSAQRSSSSGLLGVFRYRDCRNPWQSQIQLNGKKLHLGTFPTAEAAHAAYIAAKRQIHEFGML